MPRRRALRTIGTALAIGAFPALRPDRAAGHAGRSQACPSPTKRCFVEVPYGTHEGGCCHPSEECCVGPNLDPEHPNLFSWCCPKGTCGFQSRGDPLCKPGCPSGHRRCGRRCCSFGEVCCNSEKETCRAPCPRGQVLCGCVCCPEGKACINDVCKPCPPERRCGDRCCGERPKQKCCEASGSCYYPDTHCCTPGGVRRKFKIEKLEDCPNRTDRKGHQAKVNGCGPEWLPKWARDIFPTDTYGRANLKPACDEHDRCYDKCRSNRKKCDADLLNGLRTACFRAYPGLEESADCRDRALKYFKAVNAVGEGAWEDAQKEGCQCCP